jgi:hypothetical protein
MELWWCGRGASVKIRSPGPKCLGEIVRHNNGAVGCAELTAAPSAAIAARATLGSGPLSLSKTAHLNLGSATTSHCHHYLSRILRLLAGAVNSVLGLRILLGILEAS